MIVEFYLEVETKEDARMVDKSRKKYKNTNKTGLKSQPSETVLEYFYSTLKDQTTAQLFSVRKDDGTREWAELRQKQHIKIINSILSRGISTERPIGIFMAGGSGSGKSTVRNEIVIPWFGKPIIVVDCDEIKSELPEYKLYVSVDTVFAANIVHEESQDISKILLNECIEKSYSFVYDSTLAGEPKRYIDLIQRCRKKSFELILVGVDVPLRVAIERVSERAQKTNRYVPLEAVEYTVKHFPRTFIKIEPIFDEMMLFDNSKNPKLVAERHEISGQLDMYDNILYNRFKERGETDA